MSPLAISPSEDKLPGKGGYSGESPSRSKLGGHAPPPVVARRRKDGNHRAMRAGSLHHHSTFSYRDGYQMPEAHIRRAAELQMPFMALTEHGNVSSHVKFEKAASGSGVQPIYGCEFYTGPIGEGAKQTKYHLTVLARNEVGYRNLMTLVTRSYAEGFYYEPTIDMRMLRDHKEGLIVLSGCSGSLLFCSAIGGKDIRQEDASYRRALKIARAFKREFGEWYFIEVQAFPELRSHLEANPLLARIANVLRIKLVGTVDAHYCALDEAEVQMILHNIRGGMKETIEEQARKWGYDVPQCPPLNDRSFFRRLQLTGLTRAQAIEAVVTTEEIARSVTLRELPKLEMIEFPVPAGYRDVREFWRAALKDGWRHRGFHRLPHGERERAKAQLRHEMDVIEAKGFESYLCIVRDVVVYVKDQLNAPVGWARGSAAASLACYLLRITEVNPMQFPLLVFERFIDMTREDLPDIDLDFPSEVRPAIRDYCAARFGHVYNIGTFTFFKGKLALDDVARVYRVPINRVERIKDFLIERSSGDLRASATVADTIEQFDQARAVIEEHPELRKAALLEGNVKGFGVHAAGLVLSKEPIEEAGVTAIIRRVVRDHPIDVVSLDKYDAERQGLVKMDFLGLSTMSVIWDALRYLGMSIHELYDMDLADARVYRAFRECDVVGIFQFDGRAMRSVASVMKPESFSEICDCNALARPGPLHNGAASAYALIKHGGKQPETLHPAFDLITEPTQFQIVYQEQILRIVREIGNFSWTHAATIRQIISRKHGEAAFDRWWEQFLAGALEVHKRMDVPPMTREIARTGWGSCITAGAYAFNAAHCTAYGYLAHFTQWLKQYHPDVFYAFSLARTDKPERQRELLRDASKHGLRMRSPHARRSAPQWQPVRAAVERRRDVCPRMPTIRMGFEQIRGVGEKQAVAMVEYREVAGRITRSFGWDEFISVRGIGPRTIESIKAFAEDPDPFGAFRLDADIEKTKRAIRAGELNTPDRRLPMPDTVARDLSPFGGAARHATWLGTILRRNIRDIFETNRARTGKELDSSSVKDPHLNEWAMLTCEDETDQLFIVINRWTYPSVKRALFNCSLGKDLLLVEGVTSRVASARRINAKRIWVIDPED